MTERAFEFWDAQAVEPTITTWMENPDVRAHMNALIGGDGSPAWPLDWLRRFLGGRRFERAMSVGCGTGALERDLIAHGLCDSIDAFDGSLQSILQANESARRKGWGGRLRYFVGDFNRGALPRTSYDAIFFHQSLHHVEKLERLLSEVLRRLKPGGLLYIDEYVGPSASEWSNASIAQHRALYDSLPAEVRTVATLPFPIIPSDPSEAVRASEILPQLAVGFELVARRDYGGSVLSVLMPFVAPNAEATVRVLIEKEREALRNGAATYYTVAVYRPRRALLAWTAHARYFIEPKLRGVRYRVMKMFGRPARF